MLKNIKMEKTKLQHKRKIRLKLKKRVSGNKRLNLYEVKTQMKEKIIKVTFINIIKESYKASELKLSRLEQP